MQLMQKNDVAWDYSWFIQPLINALFKNILFSLLAILSWFSEWRGIFIQKEIFDSKLVGLILHLKNDKRCMLIHQGGD